MNKNKRNQLLINLITQFPNGVGIDKIYANLEINITRRTLQRWLLELADNNLIEIGGAARATTYRIAQDNSNIVNEERNGKQKTLIPLTFAGQKALGLITAPIQQRAIVGYQQNLLKFYRPNIDSYLSEEGKKNI